LLRAANGLNIQIVVGSICWEKAKGQHSAQTKEKLGQLEWGKRMDKRTTPLPSYPHIPTCFVGHRLLIASSVYNRDVPKLFSKSERRKAKKRRSQKMTKDERRISELVLKRRTTKDERRITKIGEKRRKSETKGEFFYKFFLL
jgi:hypothetical protein